MKNKKIFWMIIILIIICLVISFVLLYLNKNNKIPDDYIAIFNGGSGEITYKTYVYQKSDSKFYYINVTSTTVSWGSDETTDRVTKRGTVYSKDKIFEVAKKNNSYSYVNLKDNESYTIEEFKKIFLEE